jgi:hypothetical protein
LKHLKFNLENLKIIREFTRDPSKTYDTCTMCHYQLTVLDARRCISRDCVGVWMIENSHSMEKFTNIVRKMSMNSPGEFSLR